MSVKPQQKKVYKLVGAEVSVLLQSCFSVQGKGCIQKQEYPLFWEQVAEEKGATTFLLETLARLLRALDGTDTSQGVSLETLVTTILFITLNLPYASNRRLKKFLTDWKQQERSNDFATKCPGAKEAIRLLDLKVENGEWVSRVIIAASTLFSTNEFQRLADTMQYPTFTQSELSSGENSFFFGHIVRQAHDKQILHSALTQTINKLSTLPKQMKVDPKLAESTLLALAFMLREFIAAAPHTDPAILRGAIPKLAEFFTWPTPYSIVVRDTLRMLTREVAVPGSSFRRKFELESRTGEINGYDDGYKQRARPLFYFTKADSAPSQLFAHVMRLVPLKRIEESGAFRRSTQHTLAPTAKAMLLLNAIHSDSPVGGTDIEHFRKLSTKQVTDMYQEMTEAMDKLAADGVQADEKTRVSFANSMRESFASRVDSTTAPQDLIFLPENFPEGYYPDLPPVAHINAQCNMGYQFTGATETGLMCVGQGRFPETEVLEELKKVIDHHGGSETNPMDVRLVIAGDNELLHSFVCAYAAMYQDNASAFKTLQLKFYVVPLERNSLASYIARHDGWYNRHVLVPFRTPNFISPWIASGDRQRGLTTIESMGDELLAPGILFREFVENYVRQAEHTLPMRMYQCECWKSDDERKSDASRKTAEPDERIPFLQRFEIGIVPDARQFQQDQKLPDDIKFDEIVKDKQFYSTFNPPEIKVEFTTVDLFGNEVDNVVDEGMTFQSILLSNVPRRNDRCVPPDPTKLWLEMYAQASEQSKSKQRLRKNPLLTDPKQHVSRATFTASDNAKFLIRCDGHNFGKFSRVTVSTIMKQDVDEPLTFDVQTFFPIHP